MKKFLSLLMILCLMCGLLVSCTGETADTAEELISKADEVLEDAPYTVTMKLDFDCDNAEVNQILSAMNMEIPVTIDGENLSMVMSMEMMGESFSATATVVDKVMYYDVTVSGENVKMKASMTDEQYKDFMENQNTANMMVNPEDFGTLNVENKDGKKHIACGEITEAGLKKINDSVAESLGALDGEAKFSNISYEIILKDGKYESMILDCDYQVSVEGLTVNIDYKISAEYTYEGVEAIVAPADAADYTAVGYDDIMG